MIFTQTLLLTCQRYVQVSMGYSHCLALGVDGTAYSWGNNGHGQLGTGDSKVLPIRLHDDLNTAFCILDFIDCRRANVYGLFLRYFDRRRPVTSVARGRLRLQVLGVCVIRLRLTPTASYPGWFTCKENARFAQPSVTDVLVFLLQCITVPPAFRKVHLQTRTELLPLETHIGAAIGNRLVALGPA